METIIKVISIQEAGSEGHLYVEGSHGGQRWLRSMRERHDIGRGGGPKADTRFSFCVTTISSGPWGANTSDFEGGRFLNCREVPQDIELLW